jgi:hypothetical protein
MHFAELAIVVRCNVAAVPGDTYKNHKNASVSVPTGIRTEDLPKACHKWYHFNQRAVSDILVRPVILFIPKQIQ